MTSTVERFYPIVKFMESKPENRNVKRCKTPHSYNRTKLKLPTYIYISAYAISPPHYQEVEIEVA